MAIKISPDMRPWLGAIGINELVEYVDQFQGVHHL